MCSESIFCSKGAQKGKTCSRLLKPQKVAPNAKSCLNVAEHNWNRPICELHWLPIEKSRDLEQVCIIRSPDIKSILHENTGI